MKFDGCVVHGALAADYVIRHVPLGSTAIIELKGIDTVHGARQILSTISYCKQHNIHLGSSVGIVVGTQRPASSRGFLKIARVVYRDHGVVVRCSSKRQYGVTDIFVE